MKKTMPYFKKIIKGKKLFIFSFSILAFIFGFSFLFKHKLIDTKVVNRLGLTIVGYENFKFDVINDIEIENIKTIDFVAKSNGAVLKIKKIIGLDKKPADQYIMDKAFLIESLFYRVPLPYPGSISHTSRIPQELKPVKDAIYLENIQHPYYILHANERLGYGVYNLEEAKYRSLFIILYYVERSVLYQVEYFIPCTKFNKDLALDLIRSLQVFK